LKSDDSTKEGENAGVPSNSSFYTYEEPEKVTRIPRTNANNKNLRVNGVEFDIRTGAKCGDTPVQNFLHPLFSITVVRYRV